MLHELVCIERQGLTKMENLRKKFAVSIMTEDRPGIVASVSGCILEMQGNLAAISQTVVNGYFTIILIAEFSSDVTVEIFQKQLLGAGREGEYSVIVREYREPAAKGAEKCHSQHYVLTITGIDTSGLVYQISNNMAKRGVNIVDISGHREGDQIILVAQLVVPEEIDLMCLQDEFAAFGMKKNISVHLQHINIFKETNRI